MKGGREMTVEAIQKNEKESHDAREEAKRAEEAAERAMIIGILFKTLCFVVHFYLRNLPSYTLLQPAFLHHQSHTSLKLIWS
jgi:hypothetical protein